jgi:hypothetical protein
MGLFMDRSAALKLAIVLLVVVVLLLGIPLALPMGSGACPECPGLGAGAMAGSCLAILVGLLLLPLVAGSTVLAERSRNGSRFLAHAIDRPPRSA